MQEIRIRRATEADLVPIVDMLADDPLGATRETPHDLRPYRTAFRQLDSDPGQRLVVAEMHGEITGVLQLTIIPGLTRTGMSRGLIEGVRIRDDARGLGVGSQLLRWAIAEARDLGCGLIQLTSDSTRTEAHRFYERLGFAATHSGFKLNLDR